MNKLRNDLLFGAVMYFIVSVYPVNTGQSQTPQPVEEIATIDTTKNKPMVDIEVSNKIYENLSELKNESKKGKELSKTIQNESKKSGKTKIIVKTIVDTNSIEGKVLKNELNNRDSILTTSDSTYFQFSRNSTSHKTLVLKKKPFWKRIFSKNKYYIK